MLSPNTLNQLNRRKWLRDTALAATSVVVVPSMLIGCSDHRIPPTLGVGDVPKTPTDCDDPTVKDHEFCKACKANPELCKAAQNLKNMNAWVTDVYIYTGNYEQYALSLLKSGDKPPQGYKDFIISILTDIAIGIIGVAASGVPGLGPAIGAVVAITSENIKKWTAPGALPHTLDAQYAEFKLAHLQMQLTISAMLLALADYKDNFKNLRDGWKDPIDFNGQKYTLQDLVNAQFPTVNEGIAYGALRTAAYDRFRRQIWNVMIAKAGSMTRSNYWGVPIIDPNDINNFIKPTYYGRTVYYAQEENKSTYLRGWYANKFDSYYFSKWWFQFDGRDLSDDAAKELFKDDTPGHIINPDGLFNRDYVFKQFHTEKPDFRVWDIVDGSQHYYDLRRDESWGRNNKYTDALGFVDLPDDFEFTGGEFPQLIKK